MQFARAIGLVTACLAVPAAQAHHSYVAFDSTRTVTLSGSVRTYEWSNPHVSFRMRVAEAGRPGEEWNIETHGPAILARYGWSPTTLKAGLPIRVVCNPMRDGSRSCRLHTVYLIDTGQTLETKLSKSVAARGLD